MVFIPESSKINKKSIIALTQRHQAESHAHERRAQHASTTDEAHQSDSQDRGDNLHGAANDAQLSAGKFASAHEVEHRESVGEDGTGAGQLLQRHDARAKHERLPVLPTLQSLVIVLEAVFHVRNIG